MIYDAQLNNACAVILIPLSPFSLLCYSRAGSCTDKYVTHIALPFNLIFTCRHVYCSPCSQTTSVIPGEVP
jgi:hypothetical protein